MTSEPMTRADRETLLKIARQRERVAKTEARERAAQLVSDFELQLDREYSFDEREVWEKATVAAKAAVQAAQEAIDEECRKLGIPKAFAPGLAFGWYGKGENATKTRRIELRRIAARQIEAAEASARAAIERQSLDMQEKIMVAGLTTDEARIVLASMPTIETLMPTLTVSKAEALLADKREGRQ